MATSGTTTWSLNRDQVINAALRKLAVISGGATPAAYEVTNATEALNAMVKAFQADGMPVWAMKSHTFTTTVAVNTYNIGVSKTINTPMPLKIVQALRSDGSTYSNVPLNIYTNYNFNLLPEINSSGTPVNLYYQPFSTYGTISLWPIPDNSTTEITLRYQRPFEDMSGATDDFDFPPYWMEALIYNLAHRLAPEYGLPIQDRQLLAQEAMAAKQQALLYGSEEGTMLLQPDWNGAF